MNNHIAFINTEFVAADQASIGINDLALMRGYGIFDFFKVVHQQPLFLADHLERFYASAAYLRLPVSQTKAQLTSIVHTLILKNNLPYSGIRLTLTGGYSTDGYQPGVPNLIITQQPLQPPAAELFQKGIRLISYPYQRQLSHIKSIDYLMAVWLQPMLQQQGADDVLYYYDGSISECPRSNIFMVTQNNVLVTPARHLLKGITRMKVMKLAQPHYKVEERDITLVELAQAKEVFVTSTTRQILPVTQIDGVRVGNGKPGMITQHLNEAFTDMLP